MFLQNPKKKQTFIRYTFTKYLTILPTSYRICIDYEVFKKKSQPVLVYLQIKF